MPKRADGYQQDPSSVTFTDDGSLYDSNTGTGYTRSVTGADSTVTVLLDLGASPATVHTCRVVQTYNDTETAPTWEYSNSLSGPWTTAIFASAPVLGIGGCSDTLHDISQNLAGSPFGPGDITARYWRVSLKCTLSGCSVAHIGCREVEVRNASGVHIAENPGGAVYSDQVIAEAGGKASEADLLTAVDSVNAKAAGVANVFTVQLPEETDTAKAGGKATVSSDYRISFETITAKAGGKPSQTDVLIITDSISANAAGRASETDVVESGGGTVYGDTVEAKLAGKSSLQDTGTLLDLPTAKAGGKGSETDDTGTFSGGDFLFEFVQSKAGGKASQSDSAVYATSSTAKAAGRASQSDSTTMTETLTAKGAGKASLTGGAIGILTTTAKAGGSSSTVSLGNRLIESGSARMAGLCALTATGQTFTPTAQAKAGAKTSQTDTADLADSSTGAAAGKSSPGDLTILVDSVGSRMAGATATTSSGVFMETVTAKAGAKASQTEARTLLESIIVRVGQKPSTSTTQTDAETPIARVGGKYSTCLDSLFRPNALIPALRYNAGLALPECTRIYESLTQVEFDDEDTTLPVLVIVAQDPRPYLDGSVMDVGVWVPVDFVYVGAIAADGVTDTAQYLRQRLGVLEGQIQKDCHEQAGTLAEIVRLTETSASPMSRQNAYQEYFANIGQPVSLMVLAMEFAVVDSVVCA